MSEGDQHEMTGVSVPMELAGDHVDRTLSGNAGHGSGGQPPEPCSRSGFTLQARLSAHDAQDLYQEIGYLTGRDIEIDASRVENLSTPCVQVLVAAARKWRKDGFHMKLLEPSIEFEESLRRLAVNKTELEAGGTAE